MLDVDAVRHRVFGLSDELPVGAGPAHVHRVHQLLYVAAGALELHVAGTGTWFLPVQRMAWLEAGTRHAVVVHRPAALRTVYFDPAFIDSAFIDSAFIDSAFIDPVAHASEGRAPCQVFGASPLLVELLLYVCRESRIAAGSPARQACERALYALALEARERPLPLALPRASSRELRCAVAWLEQHLATASAAEFARRAGLSERTSARRLRSELGLSFRVLVRQLRMRRAIERLSTSEVRPSELAYELGYASPSAFSAAFRATFGETPSDFTARRR